jgi:hypothetical protein
MPFIHWTKLPAAVREHLYDHARIHARIRSL